VGGALGLYSVSKRGYDPLSSSILRILLLPSRRPSSGPDSSRRTRGRGRLRGGLYYKPDNRELGFIPPRIGYYSPYFEPFPLGDEAPELRSDRLREYSAPRLYLRGGGDYSIQGYSA